MRFFARFYLGLVRLVMVMYGLFGIHCSAAHIFSHFYQRNDNPTNNKKLASTPLFFVGNAQGNAFLQQDIQAGDVNQQILTYFMSSEDAGKYMEEMAQGNPQNANELRLIVTNMEKVMGQIQQKKQSRKLGKHGVNQVLRIQPSDRQYKNAEVVASKMKNNKQIFRRILINTAGLLTPPNKRNKMEKKLSLAIPVFSAEGLVIQRKYGKAVVPFYLTLEDLKQDWDTLKTKITSSGMGKNDKMSGKVAKVQVREPQVKVHDLLDIFSTTLLQNNKSHQKQQSFGIVPPRKEIDRLRGYYAHKNGLPGEFSTARIEK